MDRWEWKMPRGASEASTVREMEIGRGFLSKGGGGGGKGEKEDSESAGKLHMDSFQVRGEREANGDEREFSGRKVLGQKGSENLWFLVQGFPAPSAIHLILAPH